METKNKTAVYKVAIAFLILLCTFFAVSLFREKYIIAYDCLIFDNHYYIVTHEPLDEKRVFFGKSIGEVTGKVNNNQMPNQNNESNSLAVGTKIYPIDGCEYNDKVILKEIAIEVDDGFNKNYYRAAIIYPQGYYSITVPE